MGKVVEGARNGQRVEFSKKKSPTTSAPWFPASNCGKIIFPNLYDAVCPDVLNTYATFTCHLQRDVGRGTWDVRRET